MNMKMNTGGQNMPHNQGMPRRVASRMEGVVKNRGTQMVKKPKGG